MEDEKPVREVASKKQASQQKNEKNVRFKLGGSINQFDDMNKDLKGVGTKPKDQVKYEDLPNSIKRQNELDELERKKKFLTIDDIVSDSKSNKHVIYKFMKKGFTALSAEELACTMVNPTFTVDFKKNTKEDWTVNYQSKVVEKLQRCKFHMHWFVKQASASGYDDQHEAFMKLVDRGDLDKVFMYLRKNDMNQVLSAVEQKSKRSPLHIAAKTGHLHLVEFFLNKGASIDARDKLLKTPLHYACESGNMLVVKMLMENSADPFDRDNCGRTALHYAIYSGQTEILALLTQHTTDIVHMKDHAGRTALHHAVFMEANQVLMISKLLDFGADVNALDSDRRSALHHAAESNKPRVIPVLIQRGAHTSLKDNLMKKTPLELAANDHIKELMIAYCSPQYMPDEQEINEGNKQKFKDISVNKKGQIQHKVDFGLEQPIRQQQSAKPLKKKKAAKPKEEPEDDFERIPPQQAQPVEEPQVCPNCQSMKGLGPTAEWDRQQEQFIPYNMRNYQERLLQLLKRIQQFGVDSFVFNKKPYLYTGSWMEYVRNLDDLMLQINGAQPNEACMKIFNVLFPYPNPLPIGRGDESSLASFFDGGTSIDKEKESRECLPDQLRENIEKKNEVTTEQAIKRNDVETVHDLLDIRQEVMQLRSANDALNFALQQKDEMIEDLKAEIQKSKSNQLFEGEEQLIKLQTFNDKLQSQLQQLTDKNADLQNKITDLSQLNSKRIGTPQTETLSSDLQQKMTEQIEQLIEQKEMWQQKYQMVNEKNKALRHKAGQVFLQALDGAGGAKKPGSAAGKIFLEDEEAIDRMLKEIDRDQKGDLKARLKKASFGDSGLLWQKHFIALIKDELCMNDTDQIRLLRVSGFSNLKSQDKNLSYELVYKNFQDRIKQSEKNRDDCIKKIANLMLQEGINLEQAMIFFDEDSSGTISRDELNEGFKRMKVPLNQQLLKNIFVILDRNGDDKIDLIEFDDIFSKYMRKQDPKKAGEEPEEDGLNSKYIEESQPTEEVLKLETADYEELERLEEQRVMDIKSGSIPEKIIGGELVLKIDSGVNLIELQGKNKFAFSYEMPRYDNDGRMMQPGFYNQLKMQDPATGKFKIKLKLPIHNHNMYLYQEIIKVSVYKMREEETNFKQADKTYIGCIFIMWKDCVEKEEGGESPWIPFEEDLRNPDGKCTVGLEGMLTGELKWVKFGHKNSSYNTKGERIDAPKVKTFKDFQGKQMGVGGSLQLMPKQYEHPEELSLEQNYQVYFELLKPSGNRVGETYSVPTNYEDSEENPKIWKWVDTKQIAVSDRDEDILLKMVVQTEKTDFSEPAPIAECQLNLAEMLHTDADAQGKVKKKVSVQMNLQDDSERTSKMTVVLKFNPSEQPVAKPQPQMLNE